MTNSSVVSVLDHGYARLVDSMGSDLYVVRAARVSYDADWRSGENEGNDTKLINYLWKNKHTSPFEAVTLTFEIKAPIFVFRQWHRHRTWSFNEVSARYTELPEEFYVPAPEQIGVQSAHNKQVRNITGDADSISADLIKLSCEDSFDIYRQLLARGVPRELARSVLPVSTYSRMFATVDLLNLLKFFSLRCHDHAQHEIRVYAEAMRELVRPIVPVSIAAWEANRG